jgi:hypothetical protein
MNAKVDYESIENLRLLILTEWLLELLSSEKKKCGDLPPVIAEKPPMRQSSVAGEEERCLLVMFGIVCDPLGIWAR